ncbi:GNAT family N-acetyltransferase [Roseibium sp.]|uniref:GNAT family N-acetyltransferase n=1 Tax=Roseibium sp. TaxID=1936156 RepID=UPI003B52DD52
MSYPLEIRQATPADSAELLKRQKDAYVSEAERYQDWSLPVLNETEEAFLSALETHTILVALLNEHLVGSVRAKLDGGVCRIGRLFTAPGYQGKGIGSSLLRAAEDAFQTVDTFALFTGSASHGNISLYRRHGYEITGRDQMTAKIEMVIMEKPARNTKLASQNNRTQPEDKMNITIETAEKGDADAILSLQKIAFHQEAKLNGDMLITPMVETLDQLTEAFSTHLFLVAKDGPEILGSVRIRSDGNTCHIGRLFVAPGHQGRGIGRRLMQAAEEQFTKSGKFKLITGGKSAGNIRLYESLGYQVTGEAMDNGKTPLVVMEKQQG